MKEFLIAIIFVLAAVMFLLLLADCSHGQTLPQYAIIAHKGTITINWGRSPDDYLIGGQDTCFYTISITSEDSVSLNQWSTTDTSLIVDLTPYPSGYYLFKGTCTDQFGDRSDPLWSHDCNNNSYGCWLINVKPAPRRIPWIKFSHLQLLTQYKEKDNV